jgi:N utilization substance protein B
VAARTKARRRALDILFEADARSADPLEVLAQHEQRRVAQGNPPLNPYTGTIVVGVATNRERIDAVITSTSVGWSLERMPSVDRAALRVGVWELEWSQEVPAAVVIAEAVAAVSELSTDDSPKFVNGVLARLAERRSSSERGPQE